MKKRPWLSADDGNIMVTVVLVSMLVGALASLTLTTGEQADRSSARDRNSEIALGVAESGVHQAISQIETRATSSYVTGFNIGSSAAPVVTPQGSYYATVTRTPGVDEFVIDSWSKVGGASIERERHVKVTLRPPEIFPDASYALFSATNIDLKNGDHIYDGDIWANDSLIVRTGARIKGSITSAQSWIQLENGAQVCGPDIPCPPGSGNVWSGGHNAAGWAIDTGAGKIGGWAKASVSAPACDEEPNSYYNVIGASGGSIGGDLTTWGQDAYPGAVEGDPIYGQCTVAAPAKPMPTFNFNKFNYDDPSDLDDYFEFTGANAVAEFQSWLATNGDTLEGTLVVTDSALSSSDRIDLFDTTLVGDTIVITNARVYTNGIDDNVADKVFAVVSHYDPPPDSSCEINQDDQCAISATNDFDFDPCHTAVLLYADKGPVAVKNNGAACGSVIADGILMKNGLEFTYDPRVARFLGFGSTTYEIAQWEDLPS